MARLAQRGQVVAALAMTVLLIACTVHGLSTFPIIPHGTLGHTLDIHMNLSSQYTPVAIHAFYDFLCIDTYQHFDDVIATVLDALETDPAYADVPVSFVVHQLPLPYHRNSFAVAQGTEVVAGMQLAQRKPAIRAVHRYMTHIFSGQDTFLTMGGDRKDVINLLCKSYILPALDNAVENDEDTLQTCTKAMASGTEYDAAARYEFKYAGAQSVFGTPTYLINNVAPPTEPLSMTAQDWLHLISSLSGHRPVHDAE